MEWTSVSLRIFRAVAERGSFTAAAVALGYTQSAVSRQVAALERAAEASLFLRSTYGVRLTDPGRILLSSVTQALDTVDGGYEALHGRRVNPLGIRLGVFTTAAMVLLPRAITLLTEMHPAVVVQSREGSTAALLRGLRAGTLDAIIIAQQPPFALPGDGPPTINTASLVDGELALAVPEDSSIGVEGQTSLAELGSVAWIASPAEEAGLGIWPALPQKPRAHHLARDWMTKLALVAAGHGVTTVPPYFVHVVPSGVRIVRVVDGEPVRRRVTLAWVAERHFPLISDLSECLEQAATQLSE